MPIALRFRPTGRFGRSAAALAILTAVTASGTVLGTGTTSAGTAGIAGIARANAAVSLAAPIPTDSAALRSAEADLEEAGFDHIRYETKHFVILSDAGVAWTRDQGGRLERTHQEFQRAMRRLGVRPDPVRHRLVCVLFESRADYRAFARQADGVHADWVAGYYNPAGDRTVFYDARNNPSVVAARTRLAELEADLGALEERIDELRREGDRDAVARTVRQRDAWRRHLDREHDRIDDFVHEVCVATTLHEATHQLLFHTGVQSDRTAPPLWISEGLATSFESATATGAFGPGHDFETRRDGFRKRFEAGELLPIAELVTITDVGAADAGHAAAEGGARAEAAGIDAGQRVDVVYHQSYALVTWMYAERRGQLREYLETIRDLRRNDEAALLRAFEAAFGPAERVESAWLAYERRSEASRGVLVSQPTNAGRP